VLFSGVVIALTTGYVQLLLMLTFDWGDCITIGSMEKKCEGPDVKHGFLGAIVTMVLGICFAFFLEGMKGLANAFGDFAASWYNFEYTIDRQLLANTYAVWLQCVNQCAPLMIYGLLFVTPWPGSAHEDSPANANADCSDLLTFNIVGQSSFFCLSRRIGADRRRHVYRNMLTGPLLVSPFVRLIMTVYLPMLLRRLNYYQVSDPTPVPGLRRLMFLRRLWGALARLLGLIFVFDGESVGGIKFVTVGDPFVVSPAEEAAGGEAGTEKLEPEAPGAQARGDSGRLAPQDSEPLVSQVSQGTHSWKLRGGTEEILLRDTLQEVKLREFDVEKEIVEMQIVLVFVVMFAPIAPEGVFTMLLGRIIESKLELSKLLFVKRRPFPDQGGSVIEMHKGVRMFLFVLICVKVLWSLALTFMMYPKDLGGVSS